MRTVMRLLTMQPCPTYASPKINPSNKFREQFYPNQFQKKERGGGIGWNGGHRIGREGRFQDKIEKTTRSIGPVGVLSCGQHITGRNGVARIWNSMYACVIDKARRGADGEKGGAARRDWIHIYRGRRKTGSRRMGGQSA